MRGEYSKSEFFKKYPPIIQSYFLGSTSTTSEDILPLFNKADNLCKRYKDNCNNKNKVPIYMILYDNLELSQISPSNPLLLLNLYLENNCKNKDVCFIGISNYTLDIANINRILFLSVPNLEDKLAQLKYTTKSIAKNISKEISEDESYLFIFYILSRAYYLYKYYLIFIKKLMALKYYAKHVKELKEKSFKEIENEKEYI